MYNICNFLKILNTTKLNTPLGLAESQTDGGMIMAKSNHYTYGLLGPLGKLSQQTLSERIELRRVTAIVFSMS